MRYKTYKSTGTEWIESIPLEWDCKKISTLFSQRKVKVSDKEYAPLSVAKIGVVPQLGSAVKTDAGDNRKLVRAGDFVINSRSDRKGSCGVSALDGSVSLINIVLTPRQEWNDRYVHYLLRSQPFSEEYYRYGRGIVADLWTTRYSEMKNILLPIPSRGEQDQIVRYLDWKVSEVNKLIAAKKNQITLLLEQRGALIDKAILHGIRECPQKDSGIYWLGNVPETWVVSPIKRICQVNASITQIAKGKEITEMVTFLPMENVSVTGIINCSIKKPISEVSSGFSSFAKNDVVVAKITPCFENGKGACLDELDTEIGYGTTELINLRASEKVLPKYLYMITMTRPFRKLGEKVMTGSAGQKRIPVSFIKNFSLGVPSIEEQREILQWLKDMLHTIDKMIEAEKQFIDMLHELRTRLISDVVMGQVDVREIDVPEFEYLEEAADEADNEDDTDGVCETEEE